MSRTIDDIVYQIKKAKENNKPKPIVFLGAGASISGKIPLANDIVKIILEDYGDKPAIKRLSVDEKQDYYKLMDALGSSETRELFKKLIDNAKINLAHIYLAQLIKEGFIDYVLTVNFDDLLLRACSLFNYTLPVYDISNVESFTDTILQEQSLIYLHGKHYGEWLLNSTGQLKKGEAIIPTLISKISSERTWIVVGYGGNDEVFKAINQVSSFQNDLYWINYLDYPPNEEVQEKLINNSTKNAFTISGYDADTFFLDLHTKLGLDTPDIVDKPFSFLKTLTDKITIPDNNTENDEHKQLYKTLKERKTICDDWVNKAINEIENADTLENLQQVIIDDIIKNDFSDKKAIEFKEKINFNKKYENAKEQLSWYYGDWGITLSELAEQNGDENLYKLSFEKYKTASELNPKSYKIFYNWGIALYHLAKLNGDENLYKLSIKRYKTASELNPKNDSILNNWGIALFDLAKQKDDETLYKESFEKYTSANKLNPKNDSIFYNWGIALSHLAKQNEDENMFEESFEKYNSASELNPKDDKIYNNWGIALYHLAKLNDDVNLYKESFQKYQIASEINPKDDKIYNNWGIALYHLAKLNDDVNLYKESFEKYQIASKLNPKDDSIFYHWGIALKNLAKQNEDENLYKVSFEKYKIASKLNPKDDKIYNNWGIALYHLAKLNDDVNLYKESFEKYQIASKLNPKDDSIFYHWGIALYELAILKGDENLYKESLEKYQIASELNPKNDKTFYNWGTTLMHFAKLKNNDKDLYKEAEIVLQKGVDLGGGVYNLACLFALQNNKEKAFYYIEKSLQNKEIQVLHIEKDEDWDNLREEIDYKEMIKKYS